MPALMIYGATGYTGRMAAEHAAAAGLNPILAGRDGARLAQLAAGLGVDYRAFGLDDPASVDEAISDVAVLVNCAGPYLRTAPPLMTAAIRAGVHYLDIAAELDSYRLAEELDGQAQTTGAMLLPGSGGSVAMLGCLAGHASERVTNPRRIQIALHVSGSMSRGSAVSANENLTTDCLMRADGKLTPRSPRDVLEFDFGDGYVPCTAATLPDLVTIWRATNVPNIETYVHVSGDAFPEGDLSALPDGPTEEQRHKNRYQASVAVEDQHGAIVHSLLDTVNGYTFTPLASAEAARRVLGGEHLPGFHTPAELFGNRFAQTIADTTIRDL
jgi:short subunit dehydrogenase-like uncharacterized protein